MGNREIDEPGRAFRAAVPPRGIAAILLSALISAASVLAPAAVIPALAAGCGSASRGIDPSQLASKRKTSYDHFGTVCFVVVYDDFRADAAKVRFEAAWEEIEAMLSELERAVSVDIRASDIGRFNRAKGGESVAISPLTADIVRSAMEMYRFTGGAFNPAVAKLVDLWGFSPRFRKSGERTEPYDRPRNEDGGFEMPQKRYVEAFRKLSDFSRVRLQGDATGGYRLAKDQPDVPVDGKSWSLEVDFGGIAKGWAADRAAAILAKRGYVYGYVNLGMSSMSLMKRNVSEKGAPGPNMWSVSVSNPDDSAKNYLRAFGADTGVSTSGIYELRYSVGGKVYSHIIDPDTGEPTQSDVISVTLLGAGAGRDDALSTALCVMGSAKAEAFMRSRLKEYRVAMLVRKPGGLELVTNMGRREYVLER
jgi:thiamine biosynthesis lipoprotein